MAALLEVAEPARRPTGRRGCCTASSFGLEEGAITALLGANGAGKTTTLRALCGMVRTEGEVRFGGERIDGQGDRGHRAPRHRPRARRPRHLRQPVDRGEPAPGRLCAQGPGAVEEDLERVYGYFPRLKERRHQQAGTLSGGEQQMLAVSRALMLRPKLLLLDEPSFGLAPLIVREIFEILRAINQSEKVSILLVEQNAAMALDLADHAYLIETGRVVLSGTSDEIKRDDAVRRSYLGY